MAKKDEVKDKEKAEDKTTVMCLSCRNSISINDKVCPGCKTVNLQAKDPDSVKDVRTCRICGCTEDDCSQCTEKTGQPCSWVEDDQEGDLCSACLMEESQKETETPGPEDPKQKEQPGLEANPDELPPPEPPDPKDQEEEPVLPDDAPEIKLPNKLYCDGCSELKKIGTLAGHQKCHIYDQVMLPREDLRLVSKGIGSMLRPDQCKKENRVIVNMYPKIQ
jgi:hypothetical protein